MKKKLLAMVMCLTMVFGLAGCGGGGDAKDGAERTLREVQMPETAQ